MGMGILMRGKSLGIGAAALLLIYLIWFILPTMNPKPKLIAKGEVVIYATLEGAAQRSGKILKIVKNGDQLVISSCHDMKSFFVLEVEMPGGEHGFVLDGAYDLTSRPICS